ncbi:MAG: ABC-F family ATP-binding cassette domain-containing protein [Bryobacteraceae bacterium]
MSLLISCQSISKTFGARPLFENISLTISEGERIGLIGPNGAGKSTLIQILAGTQTADSGSVSPRKQVTTGYVPQDPVFDTDVTVAAVLEAAITDDHLEDYERESIVEITLSRFGFSDPNVAALSLSGGWRKRLAIAKAVIASPDLVLLDEPTNHLDLQGILWLEKFLRSAPFASVIVSHDRYFLENVASDMVEINRTYPDGLFRVKGSYSEFLIRREDFLAAQSKQQEALTNVVKREIEWLRRGAKARTRKSKARIGDAGRHIEELAELNQRTATGTTQIEFTASDRKTKKLLVAEGLSKSMGGRVLFENLNCTLSPGVRLGLVGANGSGKTTLLKILGGELEPDGGTVQRADGLRVVYFDQNREQLNLEEPLRTALSPYGDSVIYKDRTIHVAGWAKRFLFRNEQLDVAVGRLSGGERARVLIARLMLQPADLLFLDEPTNDLDIATLEVLEENLSDFPGALVLVTHDRYMLDRVSTLVLGLDGNRGASLFADYSQWEEAQSKAAANVPDLSPKTAKPEPAALMQAPPQKKRLSYLENREWETMEAQIEAADKEVTARQQALQDPEIMRDPRRLQESYDRLQAAQQAADQLYARWAELEVKQR